MRDFGKRVRAFRDRLGLSQKAFAKVMDLNLRTLQGWEIGKSVPEYAILILEALEARVKARRGR